MATKAVSFTFESNLAEVLKAFPEQALKGLRAIGHEAESNAKLEITKAIYDKPESPNYKRTGLLRNSITFALAGEPANTTSYSADQGMKGSGSYKGTAPGSRGDLACYIGTNVDYAAVNELGGSKMKARPYLKPAIENYREKYKQIMIDALTT